MLYICIPVHNEAPTVGVLLWKLRAVFQDYLREYELLVYNDGSTDATLETLQGYEPALPLTILGGSHRVGYAAALTALLQAASQRTKYARRDAVITMQGDFTDLPERIPEFVKRFEGGADIVVGEDGSASTARPPAVRRLRKLAPWALAPSIKTPGVSDPFGVFRLYRVSVIRDALKALGATPLVQSAGWAANVDALLSLAPHARRIETFSYEPRYDLRNRDTRIRPWNDAWALFRYGRGAKGRSLPALPARTA